VHRKHDPRRHVVVHQRDERIERALVVARQTDVLDRDLILSLRASASPWLTTALLAVTFTSGRLAIPAFIVFALALYRRSGVHAAGYYAGACATAQALNAIMKHAVGRVRPYNVSPRLTAAGGFVYPSADAMLAVAMNGEPLPLEHGFPVRMIVPGLYGYVSATKWLVDIELTTFGAYDAYWVRRGWAQQAPIKTESRIDTPKRSATVAAGPVTVAGIAWAQHRGIARVEVSVDGAWHPARLAAQDTIDTWRQWVFVWDATPGDHTLAVRATYDSGATQTATPADPAPNGATGDHTISVTVAG